MCARISEHKGCYNKYRQSKGSISSKDIEDFDDKFALGVHLYDYHQLDTPTAFEDSYEFTILEKCSPKALSEKEHLCVMKLRCLYPDGLNINSPLGFPLLTVCNFVEYLNSFFLFRCYLRCERNAFNRIKYS